MTAKTADSMERTHESISRVVTTTLASGYHSRNSSMKKLNGTSANVYFLESAIRGPTTAFFPPGEQYFKLA